jgi:hypothetical protein
LIFWLFITPIFAQEQGKKATADPSIYMYEEYVSDFDATFPNESAKHNFTLIREYLQQKDDLEFMLQELLLEYGKKTNTVDVTLTDFLHSLDKSLKGGVNVSTRQQMIGEFYKKQQVDSINLAIYKQLRSNQQTLRHDLWQANYLTFNLLEPDMRQQRFRMMVSMAFTLLIAALLLCFFFVIYRRSSRKVYKLLLGHSGLQFVTIFVLIIAVILFGILGVLGGSELAAILSGISGYVLGKNMQEEKPPKQVEATPEQAEPTDED